jgi:hypothetical protein
MHKHLPSLDVLVGSRDFGQRLVDHRTLTMDIPPHLRRYLLPIEGLSNER